MRIIQTDTSGSAELAPMPFDNESQLEEIVALYPSLLALQNEPPIALVKRQVNLPRAGLLDILMVNAEGLPIAVEVKLARNSQSRREVIGQLVDYVSILTSFTVDELDQSVQGSLDKALRSLEADSQNEETFEQRWQSVGTNLRAGSARYIIVVDDVPDELERIVRFLVERSNLDIRLLQVLRYRDPNGKALYVPVNIVDIPAIDRIGSPKPEISSNFQAVIDAYLSIASPDLFLRGKGNSYRFIRPNGWPSGLHYEFLKSGDKIGVEIHLEADNVRFLGDILRQFIDKKEPSFPYPFRWDQKWSKNRGRLITEFPDGTSAEEIAKAMCSLIKLTHETITAALSTGATPQSNH